LTKPAQNGIVQANFLINTGMKLSMPQVAQAPNTSSSATLNLKDMANAIRMLAMDAVKAANSGHTGMPMGMADIATVLYAKFLKFDPKTPDWFNRDRLVVSNGHGSMLLYALAYLTGYEKMTLDEIKNFRQLHSRTPGHPEVDVAIGVETTTGPLGQGIATAVGMALAEAILHARDADAIDHYTYVFMGDGCLMEGVSHEACSLAGHLKLGKLITFYDQNNVTIDGTIDLAFTEDVAKRFEAYGWHVQSIDGHNTDAIEVAIKAAQSIKNKPSIICCKTKIGFGAPTLEGAPAAHGAITGDDEIAGTRKNLNWPHAPFSVPDNVLNDWRSVGKQHSAGAATKAIDLKPLTDIIAALKQTFADDKPKKATRQLSGACLEQLVAAFPMVGGSADLTGSNNTKVKASKVVTPPTFDGNYINYGVREHGMAAALNGMALHGGIIPYAGTFMQFADYARPAIRLAALMKQRVIHVLTHDSIGLGEDGPTHQPVEHLAALRAIPNLAVFRPCDGVETAECWELALRRENGPSVLALTRQNVTPVRENSKDNKSARGAYILRDSEGEPDVTIFASGSEVSLAVEAAQRIGPKARVVSVPCMDLFFEQDGDYIQSLICNKSKKIAVEAAIRQGWDAIIGGHGTFIGMKGFGESAPAETLFNHFGITADAIVAAAQAN
jgi:transketolase